MNFVALKRRVTVLLLSSKRLACLLVLSLISLSTAQAAPPTISVIPDQGTFPSMSSRTIYFTIGDADEPASALSVTGFSSNAGLLPSGNMNFAGNGGTRSLVLTPTSSQTGTSLVSIVVTDSEGLSATNTFVFDVNYFTPVSLGIPTTALHPRWVDYDNDGDLDLHTTEGIFRNVGGTNFTSAANLGAAWRNAIDWADYDNDGDLDVAMGASGGAFIYRNNGNESFTYRSAGFSGTLVESMAFADYDNDGKLDLLSTGGWDQSTQTFTRLYHNEGGGILTVNSNSGLPAMARAATAWGDIDRDGYPDLLINGLYGGSSTAWRTDIYRNLGNGTFTNLNAGLYGLSEGSVSMGDFDNDGDLDLLTAGFNFGSYQLRVYRNNGNRTFTDLNLALQGGANGEAQWVDFDNDGYLDIFTAGCTANFCDARITTIYRNNRNGTFSNVVTGLPVTSGSSASWGDFDGDGDLDLFHNGLYRNNCPTSNSAPAAPSGLTAELLADNHVRLSWTPSADLENTNPAGLSYAVYVGTSPGLANYVPVHANTATGFRRLPERGPINTNSIILMNVPPGIHYWSVQAIDAGCGGSIFANEATFTPTNTRPLISGIANQRTVPDRSLSPISFTVSDNETPSSFLTLSATTSNPGLIPLANVVFGGSNSSRTVTITPAGGLSGTANIGIVVNDGSLTATSRFDVVVQTFTSSANVLSDVPTIPTAFCDFDNDGDLDVARNSRIYTNSAGWFTSAVSGLPVRKDNDLAWVDFDNDGDIDLSETGWDSNGYFPVSYIFRYNGGTNFTSLSSLGLTNVADGSIAWGDYDNDGDADALITGDPDTYHTPSGASAVFRNTGGTFTNTGVYLPPVCKGTAIWGDIDNDGDLDIILAGQQDRFSGSALTRVYRNDRNNLFTAISTTLPDLTECALALGDCDKDGDLDLAFAGLDSRTNRVAGIYYNTGNGTFTNSGAALVGLTQASVAWGDYDSDGLLDLALCGISNSVSTTYVYRNTGTGFVSRGGSLPAASKTSLSWGDYDKDGDLDLLVGTLMMRNDFNKTNTPPTVPTTLYTTTSSNRQVRFRWFKSSDVESGSNGLSYNLRIGTTPGGSQIMSSHSHSTNGYRRLPQMGNAGQTNSWTLTLPHGTYYWSVQAVDGGFVGSAFAAEQTLVFTNERPIAYTPLQREVLEDETLSITLSGADADNDSLTYVITAPPTNGTLVGIPPSVTYRPNTNYFGTDSFQFVVNDGYTNSAPARVSIKVTAVQDVSASTMALRTGTNLLHMDITGEPHQRYLLELSTNLVQWLSLTNLQCDRISGRATWSDTNLTEDRCFYRLKELP